MSSPQQGEIEGNIIQGATLYGCRWRSEIKSESNPMQDDDSFDILKFTALITDLVCIRDQILELPKTTNINELILILASRVDVPEGSQLIEVRHLVPFFLNWNEIIGSPAVQNVGGGGLPSLGDPSTIQDLIELHQQRKERNSPMPFYSHRNHEWVYTDGDRRGLSVPIDIILQRNGWKFHDHGDGTGLIYSWPGSHTPTGQRELLQGTCIGTLIQKTSSLGAPSLRTQATSQLQIQREEEEGEEGGGGGSRREEQENSLIPSSQHQNSLIPVDSDMIEGNSMIADSDISLPTTEPDPRLQLVEDVNSRIHSLGYTAVEVGSGGDCFFRCLAAQHSFFHYLPTDAHSLLARQLIVEFLQNHESLYQHFIPYDDQTPNFLTYLQRMSQPNTWIEGGLEVTAAAIIFNVRIHIFGSNSNHDRIISPNETNNETNDIYMVHYHDYHYRVLQRRQSSSPSPAAAAVSDGSSS